MSRDRIGKQAAKPGTEALHRQQRTGAGVIDPLSRSGGYSLKMSVRID